MPRSFKLTYQEGVRGRQGRWRKMYQGKVHYFPAGRGKYDQDAYKAALAAWEALKRDLDAAAPRAHQLDYEAALSEWEQALAWSARYGDLAMAELAMGKVQSLRDRMAAPVLSPRRSRQLR